jgi:hypothetical protein
VPEEPETPEEPECPDDGDEPEEPEEPKGETGEGTRAQGSETETKTPVASSGERTYLPFTGGDDGLFTIVGLVTMALGAALMAVAIPRLRRS